MSGNPIHRPFPYSLLRARRLIVSSEGWSWINSTLLPGATLDFTALMTSSGSPVATIQSSNVRPPVDAERPASTRTKNASAIQPIWHNAEHPQTQHQAYASDSYSQASLLPESEQERPVN